MNIRKLIGPGTACILLLTLSASAQEKTEMKMEHKDMKMEHDQDMGMMDAFSQNASTQFKQLGEKFVGLAKAVPAEKLDWRPAEGIRSIREVLTHAADANTMFLKMAGIQVPDGPMLPKDRMERENRLKTTDEIVKALTTSYAYAEEHVAALGHDALHAETKMFGRTTTNMDVLLVSIGHLHEHLGQLIAYARVNGVTPPWSAGN